MDSVITSGHTWSVLAEGCSMVAGIKMLFWLVLLRNYGYTPSHTGLYKYTGSPAIKAVFGRSGIVTLISARSIEMCP